MRTIDRIYDEGFVYDVYSFMDGRSWDVWYHGGPGDSTPLETMFPTLADAIYYTLNEYNAGGLRLHIPIPEGI